jgi:hypothetical protein
MGIDGGSTNITVTNNTIHDAGTGISYGGGNGDSNVNITNNTISRCNWGIGIGDGISTGLVITGNDISCVAGGLCNWNDNDNNFHHNGIIVYPQNSGSLFPNMVIANNFFHDINGNTTAGIFLDPQYNTSISNIRVYNNVFYTTPGQSGQGNAWAEIGATGLAANNTIIGPSAVGIGGGPIKMGTIENNIVSTVALGISVGFPTSSFTGMTSDYNDIYNLTGGIYQQMCADNPGYNCYPSVATWTAGTGFDVHSTTANPNLTASFMPNAGSPAIGAGINMTSYCSIIPTLCKDYAGSQRPMCGSWDIGAYQYCTSNCNSATCSPAFVAQPVSQTVSVGQTATFTVLAIGKPLPTYQWYKNNVAISGANAFMYTTPAATAGDNDAVFDCVLSGSVTSNTATLTVTGAPTPSTTSVAAGLNAALVYPDPVTPPYNPTIRVCPGGSASGGADIGVTIFDVSGRAVNSSDAFNFIGVPAQGEGASQQFQCYEYTWTGHKASGVYFAVVHAKVSGTMVKAKLKFAVIR